MPFLELWLIKPSGWELLARDTFGARDSIQLSSNLQNLIYPASQGLAVGKTALFSLSIEVSINKRGNEKELFNVKKYGGGFISDLSLSPNDKFAYFTHISRGISSLYQVNLSNSKVSKVGKTIDGFNLEAIDSEGNLIGIIKKKAGDESAQGIIKVSLRSLSEAQNIETDPFTFRTNSGPAVIAVGKYLIFNDEATRQLTIIDSTKVEPTLTLSLESPVDFLSPLPVNWDSKTAIPAIPDINITVKE
jgi:hypothetical protein